MIADFFKGVRERLRGQELSFTEIAKIVGENWQDPDPEERAACERQAHGMKETYYAQLTEYKKTPQWAAYQEYLADFKEKHSDANSKSALLEVHYPITGFLLTRKQNRNVQKSDKNLVTLHVVTVVSTWWTGSPIKPIR